MKNFSKYVIIFMTILFLKTTANPIILFFINEFVPDSNNFSMEIFTFEPFWDGWYLTSLTDTAYLNDGLKSDGKFIVITQDSLKSHFSLDPLNDEITLWSPTGQIQDRIIFGDEARSAVKSPKQGQSICLNDYREIFQRYYFYFDNTPTLGYDNDTSGATGWMEGFVVDSSGNPVTDVEIVYDYKESSLYSIIYYSVIPDSNGYFVFEYMSRKIDLELKLDPIYTKHLLTEQIYPGDTVTVEIVLQITDIKDMDHKPIPSGITLDQNFPNPFNNSTTFYYSLERKEYIDISIYDLQGRLVDQLYSGYQVAGNHKMEWNAGNVASGIYLITLRSLNHTLSNKCVYLK